MSFRKKILLTQILSILFFFAIVFPIIEKVAAKLVLEAALENTSDLKHLFEDFTGTFKLGILIFCLGFVLFFNGLLFIVFKRQSEKEELLKSLANMGKDFVANASHELRTPITIIKGYAETLHDLPDLSREQYTEITEKIMRNCTRMEGLVTSLLKLTDIENLSPDRFTTVDLKAFLINCRHILHSTYPDAEVTIDAPEETLLIKADAGLLELALTNLLDNAAKYSDPPAHIEIHLKVTDQIVLQIADRGRGIPKEDIEYIFHRFYRVDKTHSRRQGGAGLGLSIVKSIILGHGGTIRVESTLGKGTTFTIALLK